MSIVLVSGPVADSITKRHPQTVNDETIINGTDTVTRSHAVKDTVLATLPQPPFVCIDSAMAIISNCHL